MRLARSPETDISLLSYLSGTRPRSERAALIHPMTDDSAVDTEVAVATGAATEIARAAIMATGMAMASRRRRAGVECMRHVLRVGDHGRVRDHPTPDRRTSSRRLVTLYRTTVRRSNVNSKCLGCEDLHVIAPRQDPQTDLDRARDDGPPSEPTILCDLDLLGRMPRRFLDAGGDGGREAQHDLRRLLVRDDVPRPAERALDP